MKPGMQLLMTSGGGGAFVFSVTTDQTNSSLRALALNAGWDAVGKVFATIAPGVVLSSNSAAIAGLTISGSFPAGVELTISATAYVAGAVGGGGFPGSYYGYPNQPGYPGVSGGPALAVSVPVTITNSGDIRGGGGGGGGGASSRTTGGFLLTGGKGGNGAGGNGAGATAGGAGASGAGPTNSGAGGYGGNLGAAGSPGGGGTGWDDGLGYISIAGGAAGAGGAAVTGNSNITWLATGTRTGSVT